MKTHTILHSIGKNVAAIGAAISVLTLVSSAPAAQIGLKIGMNGNGGFQGTNAGALQPGDLAGAPGYQQTNWNVLGRFGSNINPTNSFGVATTVFMNWDSTGNFSQQGGGNPTAQGSP